MPIGDAAPQALRGLRGGWRSPRRRLRAHGPGRAGVGLHPELQNRAASTGAPTGAGRGHRLCGAGLTATAMDLPLTFRSGLTAPNRLLKSACTEGL